MIKRILLHSVALFTFAIANAATVDVWNMEGTSEEGFFAHSLFDSRGKLLSGTLQNNIRLGAFSDGFDAAAAWSAGDLTALNDEFTQFDTAQGMYDLPGHGGAFETQFESYEDYFAGRPVILWVGSQADFLNPTGQHLIFRFSAVYQDAESEDGLLLSLTQDSGDLLVGEYGNYSYDYGFGALPGYNLVGVIPEPSTYALLAGAMILGLTLWSRRHRIGAS